MGTLSFLCAQMALFAILLTSGLHPVRATEALFLAVVAFEAMAVLPRAGVLAGHAALAARRIVTVASAPLHQPEPSRPQSLPSGWRLQFEDVHFRWSLDRPAVFAGLNIDIPPGQNVAILGASGAGKSTLAALALKVAAPQHGRIRLGGCDLNNLAATDVRSQIAWLGQTTHLFDDTIRANLLLGRPDATDAELWAALDHAAIGDLVRILPEGLDSWVGESGARFSGGQSRRLALARTLLSRAPILILDEPAAGLDADTERAFLQTLYANIEGRSSILIVHRLTGAEKLDRIWRLSNGTALAATG